MTMTKFVYSSVGCHLNCLQFGAFINKVVVNTLVRILVDIYFHFSWIIHLGTELVIS